MKSLTFPFAVLFLTLFHGLVLTQNMSTEWTHTMTPITPTYVTQAYEEYVTASGGSSIIQNGTTLYKCAGPYIASISERGRYKTFRNVTDIGEFIAGEMEQFCSSYARDMSACFKGERPNPSYYPDVLIYLTFDMTNLDSVIDFGCPRIKAVSKHGVCIVKYFTQPENQNVTLNCLQELRSAFSFFLNENNTHEQKSTVFCRSWALFATCMEPHLSSCSKDIGPIWLESVYRALGPSCRKNTKTLFPDYIQQIDKATSARATLSFILLCLIVSLLY